MKKRTTIILCVLIGIFASTMGSAKAQIHKVINLPDSYGCDTSIVRYWNQQYVVLYAQSPRGNLFYLVDANNTVSKLIPTSIYVKDMEIVGDTIYYCGANASGNAFIGYFTITDLMSTNVTENLVEILPGGQHHNLPFFPKRMEVYHVSTGLHIVMVCDIVMPSDSIKRVMMDGRSFYGTTTWAFDYAWPENLEDDQSNIFYPDDVIVTDNYVVFIGHKHCSAGIYMKKFYKPSTLSNFFIHTYSLTSNYYNIYHAYMNSSNNFSVLGQTDGEHPVWGTHINGDTIAIACMSAYMNKDLKKIYGSTVKKFHINPLDTIDDTTYDLFFPYSEFLNRGWVVKDLRYDKANNNLLMLYDADSPIDGSIESMAMVIDNAQFNSGESKFILSHKTDLKSLDKFWVPNNRLAACGKNTDQDCVCSFHIHNGHICTYDFTPLSIKINGEMIYFDRPTYDLGQQASRDIYVNPVKKSAINIICE